MYIKKIVIQGFKTYKNTTIIDSFSPHYNVVVGRNGSGKSNFFAAIRFVLSDAYTHMTREERQSLIHEGSGTVMSAFVEIVFDNQDRRFPIDKDEVIIRRTIGLKKDDYSLDHKSATRSDIMNLLESAGFSKSNPYYIVPQGRITTLTNAKDHERLALLKEVAGAKIFEVKLKESLKEMDNSSKRREKIDEMLSFIENRLEDLNLEKNDLKNFEKLKNSKKILEFNLFDKELTTLNDSIEEINMNYNNFVESTNNYIQDLTKRESVIKKFDESIVVLNSNKKLIEIDKQQIDLYVNDLLSKISSTKLKLAELASSGHADQLKINKENLANLNQIIIDKEAELMSLDPTVDEFHSRENELNKVLLELKSRQRLLLAKQGRYDKFKSKKERDNWLKSEISKLQNSITSKNEDLDSLKSNHQSLELQIAQVVQETESLNGNLTQKITDTNITSKELYSLKETYNTLIDERKSLWREDSRLRSILSNYQNELDRSRQQVNDTMDRAMSHGLEAVRRITENLKLDGVYGPLGELIEVSEKYKTAVEVVGGNSLFHIVVDNDQTATIIMDELIREKAGRVTFMPLNRIKSKPVSYPEGGVAVPLIKKIGFEPFLEPIVRQVFGKTVVVYNLEKGAEISKNYKLNAITLDGDRCDRKGVLTGGFREFERSRLDTLRHYKKWKKEFDEIDEKLLELEQKLNRKDQEINAVNEQVTLKRKAFDENINARESLKTKILELQNKEQRLKEELINDNTLIHSLEESLILLTNELKEHNSELSQPFKNSVTTEELNEMSELNSHISSVENELTAVTDKLNEIELESSKITSELNDNLRPRKEELLKKLSTNDTENDNEEKEKAQNLLNSLNKELEELNSKSEELSNSFNEICNELAKNEENLNKANDSQRAILKKLDNLTKNSEKSLNKKASLSARRDEVTRKIRELGILPEEAFTSFKNDSAEFLLKELNRVNDKLKKYNHINRKALEQSITFTKQRDDLVSRRDELDTAKQSIEDLINVLEQRKDEAIIRTFKEVGEGFTEIFEKLVPRGTGKLIMQRRSTHGTSAATADDSDVEMMDDSPNDNDYDDSSRNMRTAASSSIDNYIGVSIEVSFNSKNDEQQRIEQLSGGQKTVCAIALILAIQKCDPAPFYAFDEIDAALDTQYRISVAKLINELTEDGKQFICTTFRPEMLEVADTFLGVIFSNKVSTVSEINREEALGFIEGQS
ncbi:hypothetical protein PACTADRAFT_3046 [Pachysolen tannophilus NRRL Y-2460]|uniref:Structural maintenance of chromosomes protein n=1 Tax=Pachysolen tannophilus NRRL Y-2460 TaxID=669874 RepID=A0A1E4TU99_PACTA|nr:hypothetical protein PACTADRAFT_3046 [Pachysolen tannophilus NRRL Y-2460]